MILADTAIVFEPMSAARGRATYYPVIRVSRRWPKIEIVDVGLQLLEPDLVMPKSGGLFLLDGVHRITELRPRIVLIDWIRMSKRSLRYFADMHNPLCGEAF